MNGVTRISGRDPRAGAAERVDRHVHVQAGFWRKKLDTVVNEMVPYQWQALNDQVPGAAPSHAVENFRIAAGDTHGAFAGTVFQDSDVAKWIEAASYGLVERYDKALDERLDELIDCIGRAQRQDGYLNTFFTVKAPDRRWSDLVFGHELYCAGHLIEAAVAHHWATGKRSFLDIMCRYADLVARVFGTGEGQRRGYCGHPEIELALFRLYRVTNERRYLELATFFVDERGRDPGTFDNGARTAPHPYGFAVVENRWQMADYFLAHEPVRDQHEVTGHSVRAMYLYSAMADQYRETGDRDLWKALQSLWRDLVSRKIYVTGGLGSQSFGERFTIGYDLPGDTAYAETCASIGLVFWAQRMLLCDPRAEYADVMETALYNGILSGVSLDGARFFYVNPLEVCPDVARARHDHAHVETGRIRWFGCACCPPNIARLIASVSQYFYTKNEDTLWVQLYGSSTAELRLGPTPVTVTQTTEYPWNGRVVLCVQTDAAASFTVALRIPSWSPSLTCTVCGRSVEPKVTAAGYLEITRTWAGSEDIVLELAMPIQFLQAHPGVRELAGRIAIRRGPLIYCVESCDNDRDLHLLTVDPNAGATAEYRSDLMGGTCVIHARGHRVPVSAGARRGQQTSLYRPLDPQRTRRPVRITAVPYHQWGNREANGEMTVWLREG